MDRQVTTEKPKQSRPRPRRCSWCGKSFALKDLIEKIGKQADALFMHSRCTKRYEEGRTGA